MKCLFSIVMTFLFLISCGNIEEEVEAKNIIPENETAASQQESNSTEYIVFQKRKEPRENAFSILVPKGWEIEGGIYRVDPTAQGGPSQSIAAKLDFSVKKDDAGTVLIRWLPDVLFYDARYSPAGQMGLFPEGSNYSGMTVYNIMSASDFIQRIAFPYAHPNVSDFKIVENKNLSQVAQNYSARTKAISPYLTMSYDAAMMKINYVENGIRYEERMISIIENWGELGAGMWGNKETFLIKTPAGEFEDYAAIFSTIQNSVEINSQWLTGELRGQMQRAQIVRDTQKEIERIGREITEHRQKTNAEIQNDMYLTLMEQEEYVNPFTNKVEIGTNQWKHRWTNDIGDIIYTDNEDYDPNTDINLNIGGFKRTPVRKRFGD